MWFEKTRDLGLLRPGETRDDYFLKFVEAVRYAKKPLTGRVPCPAGVAVGRERAAATRGGTC